MKKLFIFALLAIALGSCKTTETAAYHSHSIQCLGIEHDGSQTLVSWGEGKNNKDAVEQAKKNAVYAVVFDGIHAGKSDCTKVPLVNTPNARQKYEDYFNTFFADGGEYLKYVNLKDEKRYSRDTEKYQYGQVKSVTVRVLRSELKKRLQDDGILPK